MQRNDLSEIIRNFAGKRVLILGDLILDEYLWGNVRRISPEAPVPVVELTRRSYRPGGAANTAANVVRLGGAALLAGVVGVDTQAEQLRAVLRSAGIDGRRLQADVSRRTTTKTRIMAHHQQVVRVDDEQIAPLTASLEAQLLDEVEEQMEQVHAFILSDYAKGVVTPRLAERFIRLARSAGKPIVVDPKGINFEKYRGADVVKPNMHEVGRFLNAEVHDDVSLGEAGQRLLTVLDGSAVLITRGAQGMSLFRREQAPWHLPAQARYVFDVTGAGDTVASILALALAVGATLEQAAILANQAAGIVVGKVGTAQVTPEELGGQAV